MAPRRRKATNRYSAKLLFEFFITVDGQPMVRRMCEERIVIIRAANAKDALRAALGGRAKPAINRHLKPGH